jgi:hypothetical protein
MALEFSEGYKVLVEHNHSLYQIVLGLNGFLKKSVFLGFPQTSSAEEAGLAECPSAPAQGLQRERIGRVEWMLSSKHFRHTPIAEGVAG